MKFFNGSSSDAALKRQQVTPSSVKVEMAQNMISLNISSPLTIRVTCYHRI